MEQYRLSLTLTPWSTVLLENVMVTKFLKEFIAFLRIRRFITVLTRDCSFQASSRGVPHIGPRPFLSNPSYNSTPYGAQSQLLTKYTLRINKRPLLASTPSQMNKGYVITTNFLSSILILSSYLPLGDFPSNNLYCPHPPTAALHAACPVHFILHI
jgi:hypothetical protein